MTPKQYDRQHLKHLSAMDRRIDQLFDKALKRLASYGIFLNKPLGDQPFSFADYPEVQRIIDGIFEEFRQSVEVTITDGLEWEDNLSASKATDIASRYGVAVAQQRSQAVAGFAQRKVGGLDLSQRVWNITSTFEKEVETAMDIALRDGTPANRLATDLKQYLKHPDKLFRRVRDEHGQLQLSKRAKEFHPGQGVYRSSYKNARRLAVTETNMAYHKADNERWRQLDFVLGYEVQVSGTNPNVCPICVELAGKYPKEFEFVGWHPHCRCHAVPIMEDVDSFQARQDALLRGERIPAKGQVTEPPKNFTDHLKDNSDRIQRASRAGTLPYFVRDNYKVGKDGTLTPTFNAPKKPSKPEMPSILERAKARHEARTPEEVKDIKRRLIQRNADIRHANRKPEEVARIKQALQERNTPSAGEYPQAWRTKNLANAQKRHEARTEEQKARINNRWTDRSVARKMGTRLDYDGMTFEDADKGCGNVGYNAGYGYAGGRGYRINCQSCVVAHEMRLRGIHVTARPNTGFESNMPYKLSWQTQKAWIDPKTGEMPKVSNAGGWVDYRKNKTLAQRKSEFLSNTQETGRYHMGFAWKGGRSGHIVTLERKADGSLSLYDPQAGTSIIGEDNILAYIARKISPSYPITTYRVDNLALNTDVVPRVTYKTMSDLPDPKNPQQKAH